MNIVELIEDQLTGDSLNKLSSLIGADSGATAKAAGAAVPAILSGLAGLASSESGTKKLTSALGGFTNGGAGSFAQMLNGGDGSSLLSKGQGLLGSLMGDQITGGVASSISRFSGLDSGIVKKLLGYLLPVVMKVVGGQWQTRGGSPAALTKMFAEQKANIADSIPSGFSLPQLPGLSEAAETTRRAAETAGRASRSVASWAIPLAILVAVGLLLWNAFGRRQVADASASTDSKRTTVMRPTIPDMPAIPTPAQLTDEMGGLTKSIGEAFTGIKDAASAEAAVPKLEELNGKLDAVQKALAQLPEASRDTLKLAFADRLGVVKEQASKTLAAPGIGEKIRALILQIVRKLEELGVISKMN